MFILYIYPLVNGSPLASINTNSNGGCNTWGYDVRLQSQMGPPKQGQSAAEGDASMNQIYSKMLKSLALISSGQLQPSILQLD